MAQGFGLETVKVKGGGNQRPKGGDHSHGKELTQKVLTFN